MREKDLSQLYKDMQREMLHNLSVGRSAFDHTTTVGNNTETNWIEWFRNYLPKRYMVDTGIIIDSTGRQSDQIDLIIFDAQYSYLVFKQGNSILIPAESVYAVFEVKQKLNKKNIEYAGAKARSVRGLHRTTVPIRHAGGKYPEKKLHEIVAGILTTKSDWKTPVVGHVVEYVKNCQKDDRLDFVCSISDSTVVINNSVLEQPEIKYCGKDESLVYLLLNLLKRLQDIGTVPAIKYSAYEEKVDSKTVSW